MENLTPATLKGNWATLLLPIGSNNGIDFGLLADEIDQLIDAGVDGIYSNGTAGEFHNQTEDEFDRINQLLLEKCKAKGMRFQVGASHPSPVISLGRLKRSTGLKPDAFQVILPDWVTATLNEQVDFMQEMAANSNSIPLVLYNPPHAKLVLKPKQLLNLKHEVPQLIGVKVAYGDLAWVAEMRETAKQLSVFVPGHFLATGVKDGVGSGAYSNVACINAKTAQKWWQQMQADMNSALELQQRIQAFFKECIVPFAEQGYSNPALDKFLATVGGYVQVGTRLRWPYRFIPESEVAAVRKRAKQLIPEFFN